MKKTPENTQRNGWNTRWVAAGVACLLCACQAGAERPEPMELPALPAGFAGERAPQTSEPVSFAEAFGDGQLAELIDEALQRNQDLGAAAARVLASASAWKGARANFAPTLDGTAGGGRSKQVFVGLPIPGGSNVLSSYATSFDAGLSASWEPDFWGRLSAAERAAEASVGAQAEQWRAARLSIAAGVAKGWYSLLASRLQREWAEEAVQAWQQSLEEAQARLEAGVGTALDVALLESRIASAKGALAARRAAEGGAARSLEILLGRYPAGELESQATRLPAIPALAPGLPADLIARRPDLKAIEWRLQSLHAQWDVARAELYPRLVFTGTLGQASDALEDLLDGDFTVWSLAARLTGPLWDGGRRAAAREGVEAQIQEAEFQFMGLVLLACGEVEGALDAETHLTAQERALEDARRASTEARDLVQARRDQGLVPISEVLEAERARITAESEWLRVRHERILRRIELIAALGGGLSVD